MNQSEHEVNTCNRHQASKPRFVWRQKNHRLRSEANQSISEITFDTQLKTAL